MIMKKTIILTFAVLLAGLFMASCDKIEEGEYLKKPNNSHPTPADTTGQKTLLRKVLILDFTGHKCGNCSKGHKMITSLESTYHDAVVPVAIHCSNFAKPEEGTAFATDFRTEEGNYMLSNMDIEQIPSGLVNTLLPSAISDVPTEWAAQFAEYVNIEPELSLEVVSSVVNGSMSSTVKLTAENVCTRKLSLCVYVVEDNIISGQLDYDSDPSIIEDYVHNHVLRMSFNGALGESVKEDTEEMAKGATIEKSYSKAIKPEWNISNCKVVAFVYDSDTKEVLQAEAVSVQ
jgi:hypothetical protein